MIRFGDLVEQGVLAIGDGYRARNEELGIDGPIFLRSAYLQDCGWVLSEPDRISHAPQGGFGAKIARLGDTVLTTKGNSLGRLGYVGSEVEGAVYSPHLSYWRSLLHSRLDRRYLYYWAHSSDAVDQIRARSQSTDMAPYLSLSDQLNLNIKLPDIDTQRAVGECLRTLDERIELNRRIAETLEAMARGLFKSWFVDFEPVHARAEGRHTGLPDEIASMFPDNLDENGVPTGWADRADAIGWLVRSPIQPADVDPGTPYVGLEHLERGSLIIRAYGQAYQVNSLKSSFKSGDLLFGKLRPYFNKVAVAPCDGICSSDILVFRPADDVPSVFLYCFFSEPGFVAAASNASSGTRMPRADWTYMRRLPATLPPPNVRAAFSRVAKPMLDRMLATAREANTLAALRDTLLPRLITGELRIANAERQIAAA